MLSILIPIYNQDVRPLVYTLTKQCAKLKINYQILCFDDKSDEKYRVKNRELAFVFGVNYTEMPENMGRSRIRNWLGNAAYYPHLLFLDGDSKVQHKDFIKQYLQHLPYEGVIYGGRNYVKRKPANKKKILHWKYGTYIESKSAKQRNKKPYLHFMSNNFIVHQDIFKRCRFDEKTKGYGFEDLEYARQLQKSGVTIKHIDNPVQHDGLELNTVFLNKTENAVKNLILLEDAGQIPETRLLSAYKNLKSFGLVNIFYKVAAYFVDRIQNHLLGPNPGLWLLQIWKLYLYVAGRVHKS